MKESSSGEGNGFVTTSQRKKVHPPFFRTAQVRPDSLCLLGTERALRSRSRGSADSSLFIIILPSRPTRSPDPTPSPLVWSTSRFERKADSFT